MGERRSILDIREKRFWRPQPDRQHAVRACVIFELVPERTYADAYWAAVRLAGFEDGTYRVTLRPKGTSGYAIIIARCQWDFLKVEEEVAVFARGAWRARIAEEHWAILVRETNAVKGELSWLPLNMAYAAWEGKSRAWSNDDPYGEQSIYYYCDDCDSWHSFSMEVQYVIHKHELYLVAINNWDCGDSDIWAVYKLTKEADNWVTFDYQASSAKSVIQMMRWARRNERVPNGDFWWKCPDDIVEAATREIIRARETFAFYDRQLRSMEKPEEVTGQQRWDVEDVTC